MKKALPDDLEILKNVIEQSPIPMALYVGEKMQIKLANPAMLDVFGKSNISGKTFKETFEHTEKKRVIKLLGEAYRTSSASDATVKQMTIRLERRSEAYYFDFIFRPLKDPDGKVFGVLHTAVDVTRYVAKSHNASSGVYTEGVGQQLLSVVENSVDFIGISDIDLRLVYLNAAGKEIIGLDADADISGIRVEDFYAPDSFYLVNERIAPGLQKDGKWSGVLYLRNFKTGEDIPFHANFIQIKDQITGEPIGRGATLRDLRAEISVNEALVLSEKRFRDLVEEAPVAIGILKGEQFEVEIANKEILRLLGKEKSVIGLPVLQAVPEIKEQIFPALLQKVLDTGEPVYGNEAPAYFQKNEKMESGYFNFVFAPVKEVDGQVSGVIVVGHEVTSQVEYKKQLEESEQRFRSIVLEAPVAKALYVGRDMVIDLANESMIKLWGKDGSVIGKKLREAVPELEGQPFFDILDQVYATGVPYHTERQSAELVVDGKLQTFWFNFTYKPLRDPKGNVYAILNTAVDISSQVLLQKQKDDFLGVASHELKTPVTSIKAYAQVLETMLRDSGDPEKANMVQKLDHQVSRLTNLISDLLDVTKFNSGKIKFHRSYFDFNDMVSEMVEEVQRTTQKHTIVEKLGTVGEVCGDRERIGQVVVNLVTNAVKYSPDASKVLVTTRLKNDFVELCVEDFGIGISKEKQSKVFEQFYRVGGEKQHTFPGLGLGLYISSEIIQREGGRIWVDSVEGKGSRFYFSLPKQKQV